MQGQSAADKPPPILLTDLEQGKLRDCDPWACAGARSLGMDLFGCRLLHTSRAYR